MHDTSHRRRHREHMSQTRRALADSVDASPREQLFPAPYEVAPYACLACPATSTTTPELNSHQVRQTHALSCLLGTVAAVDYGIPETRLAPPLRVCTTSSRDGAEGKKQSTSRGPVKERKSNPVLGGGPPACGLAN